LQFEKPTFLNRLKVQRGREPLSVSSKIHVLQSCYGAVRAASGTGVGA
jgi:hypothetical protein